MTGTLSKSGARIRIGVAYLALIAHEQRVVRLRHFLGRDRVAVVDLSTGIEYERGVAELGPVPEGTVVPVGWGPLP